MKPEIARFIHYKNRYNHMYRLETIDITRFKDMKPDLTRFIHKKTDITRFNKIYT